MRWCWSCRLPARLGHSGHVAVVRGVAQADPAEAELAEIRARPAAAAAAVIPARLELRIAALPDPLRCLRHQLSSLSLEVSFASLPSPSALASPPLAGSAPSSPSSPSSGLTGFS